MELIGELKTEKLSENELLCEWIFKKVVFNKSYRSQRFESHISNLVLPHQDISAGQFSIVPDNSQSAIQFLLFLYGYEGQSEQKIIFSPCLMDKVSPKYKVSCSDVCLNLGASMKIFEIHSSHPILFNCDDYVFKLKIKLYESLNFTPLNAYISAQDTEACDRTLEVIPNNVHYLKELSQDMWSLYTSGHLCDLEIRIGEDILRVHKPILCARSPVFKKMMEHDCLESSSNSITITDCSTPTFVKFLKYIYTGEIEGSPLDTVMSLYSLGDKYDVPVLREACSNLLQTIFSSDDSAEDVSNIVCHVLQLAECHGDSKLKDLAASFIVNHFPVVSNKEGWKDLMKNNFELISNILALVASGLHKQVYKTVPTK